MYCMVDVHVLHIFNAELRGPQRLCHKHDKWMVAQTDSRYSCLAQRSN